MLGDLTIPLSISELNTALNKRVSQVTTDGIIAASINPNGGTLTLSLLVDVLLARIPKGGLLPTGQYQYQGFYMVSQNQTGWDFLMAHPLL